METMNLLQKVRIVLFVLCRRLVRGGEVLREVFMMLAFVTSWGFKHPPEQRTLSCVLEGSLPLWRHSQRARDWTGEDRSPKQWGFWRLAFWWLRCCWLVALEAGEGKTHTPACCSEGACEVPLSEGHLPPPPWEVTHLQPSELLQVASARLAAL